MGTPAYAPPEMLSYDIELPHTWRQSQTIDTYALSSILYELYAGRRPYPKAPDDPRSSYRLKTEEKPDPLELRDPDGGALAGIIATGLSAQQEDRPTVAQMKAALENWKRMPAQRQISGLRGTKRKHPHRTPLHAGGTYPQKTIPHRNILRGIYILYLIYLVPRYLYSARQSAMTAPT
jgi:serine/threonine protein kinase